MCPPSGVESFFDEQDDGRIPCLAAAAMASKTADNGRGQRCQNMSRYKHAQRLRVPIRILEIEELVIRSDHKSVIASTWAA